MNQIRFCLIGTGYVGCTLVSGIEQLKQQKIDYTGVPLGEQVEGYTAQDLSCVLAFDVDGKKIGKPLDLISKSYPELQGNAAPTITIQQGVELGSLDGMPITIKSLDQRVSLADACNAVSRMIRDTEIDVVIIATPTEAMQTFATYDEIGDAIAKNNKERLTASIFYAYAALMAARERKRGICVINGIPSEIANSPAFIALAQETNSIVIGDDLSTGQSRLLSDMMEHFKELNRTVTSLVGANWGGNMDFCRLQDSKRNESKKKTKTGCASDILGYEVPSDIRPHGYLPPLGDRKAVLIHVPYKTFGGIEDELFIVGRNTDSPAAAGMLVDLVRLGKIALDRRCAGAVSPINGFYCKRWGKQKSKVLHFQDLCAWLHGEKSAI
ncbi:MAG: inositol-3-phosphate synthase [Candidatus Aenigmarchaeota archaeon]|nr:inositol-3-phosphate synthase [Candidatus Aenigmarchaeota archaeon]